MDNREVIELLNSFYEADEMYAAAQYAIQAIEELEKYQELGTVEELKQKICDMEILSSTCKKLSDTEVAEYAELSEYQSLGTLEQVREAVERMEPKRIIARKKAKSYLGTDYYCPACNKRQLTAYSMSKGDDCCKDCGQKLNWSVEE